MVYLECDNIFIILVQFVRWDVRLPFPLSQPDSTLVRVDPLPEGFEMRSIVFDALIEFIFVLEIVCNAETRQGQ